MSLQYKARYLKPVQDALSFVGLLFPETDDKKTVWYFLMSMIFPFMLIDSFVSIFMHGVDFYLNLDSLLSACEIVMLTFLHIKCLTSAACLIVRKKEIAVLIRELDEMYARVEETNPGAPVVIRTMKLTKRLVVVFPAMYCGITAALSASILPFVTPLRETYFRLWYPYDPKAYPNYELTMSYHTMQYLLLGLVLSAADGLFLIMLMQVWTLFVMFNDALRNIRQFSVKQYETEMSCVSEAIRQKRTLLKRTGNIAFYKQAPTSTRVNAENNSSQTPIRVSENNSIRVDDGRNSSPTLFRVNFGDTSAITHFLVHNQNASSRWDRFNLKQVIDESAKRVELSDVSGSSLSKQKQIYDTETTKTIIDTDVSMQLPIKKTHFTDYPDDTTNLLEEKHKFLLRENRELQINVEMQKNLHLYVKWHQQLIRSVRKIEDIFGPMLVTQLMMNLISVVAMTLYIHLVPAFDSKAMTVLMVMGIILYELCAFCWLSEKITSQSCEVKESVFGCDWLESSESFKREIRIIISRANQPVHVMIAGIVPLTMTLFQDVTNNAYSLYKVLHSITQK